MECRPTVKDIFDYIDSIAPFEAQCDWDNSGLIVGSFNAQVNKIGVVLDITCDAVKYAAQNGIDLIVSHHPVIFRAVKNFYADDPAFLLAKNGISAICAHTSLDIAKGGVNDALAAALGFENAFPLTESGEEAMVRVAEIKPTTADELAELVADKLSTCVAVADGGKEIRKVALCGGAGSDFFEIAGCDAYITGEVKHHEFFKAAEAGITLIAAGHFETENPVVAVLAENLKNNFGCEVEIIPQKSPVKYYR
ncbi:MAG: Nif3-like dinuclear metal center hexameric protein [Clostridia bacterium]|nr:Nif3-like dinuclear metal center hexameric protein [Clostridia bacterium]